MRLRFAFSAALAAAASPVAGQKLPYVFEDGEQQQETAKKAPYLDYALLDRFEWAAQRGEDGFAWDFSLLYGGDRNRIWLSNVGEGSASGTVDYLELQALYARAVGGGWDLNAGLRYDAIPAPRRAYFVLGGQLSRDVGEGDFWLGAFAYASHKSELSARLGAVYNHPLGDRLVLQPSFELNASAEDVPELYLGRGLTYAEAGLRLRYRIHDRFAPYVGVSWERSLGRTGRIAREEGEDPETKSLVMGVRSEF